MVLHHPLTIRKILCGQIVHLRQNKERSAGGGHKPLGSARFGPQFQNIFGWNENNAEAKVSLVPEKGSELTGESLKVAPTHTPSLKPHH